MEDTENRPQRINVAATKKREALALAASFLRQFEDWNCRAALLGARMSSWRTPLEEKVQYRKELATLLREVETSRSEFERAVLGAPPHSRLDDIRASYDRLTSQLRAAWFE